MYSQITRSRYDCWKKVLSQRQNVDSDGAETTSLGHAFHIRRHSDSKCSYPCCISQYNQHTRNIQFCTALEYTITPCVSCARTRHRCKFHLSWWNCPIPTCVPLSYRSPVHNFYNTHEPFAYNIFSQTIYHRLRNYPSWFSLNVNEQKWITNCLYPTMTRNK